MSLATFTIFGRVEKPVEVRNITNGQVANIFLRTIPQLNPDGTVNARQQTFPITVFSDYLIDVIIPSLRPGHSIVVSGRIERRRYESNGRTVYSNDLVASTILVVGGPTSEVNVVAEEPTHEKQSTPAPVLSDIGADDVPF